MSFEINPEAQALAEMYKKYTENFFGKKLNWVTHHADEILQGKLLLRSDQYPDSDAEWLCSKEQLELLVTGYQVLGLKVIYEEPLSPCLTYIVAFVNNEGYAKDFVVYVAGRN